MQAMKDEDWRTGTRVAHFHGLKKGKRYRLHVSLYLGNKEVISRPVSTLLHDDRITTVMLARNCEGVSCPEAGDSPEATACLGGRCVDPQCTDGTQETCPTPTCREDSDCPDPPASCAVAECENGTCWSNILPNVCSPTEYCNINTGCESLSVTDSGFDAGSTDAGVPDSGSSLCQRQVEIPFLECEALVTLYVQTEGIRWRENTNWMTTDTPCSWFGVTCEAGSVHSLVLHSNRLSGPLPPQIGHLENLRELDLHNNRLNETIPSQIGNLIHLTNLQLHVNEFTGAIPPRIGDLIELRFLELSSNELQGTIPIEFGNLPHISEIWLSDNQLSGEIPPQLGSLLSLDELWLQYNQLSGAIPPELGDLENLTQLWLNNNQLQETIPIELGNLSNLQALSLHSNQLRGAIPAQFANLSNLTTLFLQGNLLEGPIPTAIEALDGTTITLSENGCFSSSSPTLTTFLMNKDRNWENGCVDESCSDRARNGTETDIDCGGLCMRKCAVTNSCEVDSDCESTNCVSHICVL